MNIANLSGHDDSRAIEAYGEQAINRIHNTSILVVGSDTIAQYVLAGLAGLGIRKGIYFLDNKRISTRDKNDFLCIKQKSKKSFIGHPKIEHLESKIRQINPSSTVRGRFFRFNEAIAYKYEPDIVIDTTNDPNSKRDTLHYAQNYGLPFISASSNDITGIVAVHKPSKNRLLAIIEKVDLEKIVHEEYSYCSQGSIPSGVISGIVLEEARKMIHRTSSYDTNLPNCEPLVYNPLSETRSGVSNVDVNLSGVDFSDSKVLVVGAGGIGTYAALNLALAGIGDITIMDYQDIEASNLNRQILFYNSIGKKKAEVMRRRLLEINPDIKVRVCPLIMNNNRERMFRYGLKLKSEEWPRKYDLVLGCVDNRNAREVMDRFCFKYRIPYIDGATNYESGFVVVYNPGKTPRITKQANYPEGTNEDVNPEDSASCAQVIQPSVVMSNMVVGSAMVAEALLILRGHDNPNILKGIFRYDSSSPNRLYVSKRIRA